MTKLVNLVFIKPEKDWDNAVYRRMDTNGFVSEDSINILHNPVNVIYNGKPSVSIRITNNHERMPDALLLAEQLSFNPPIYRAFYCKIEDMGEKRKENIAYKVVNKVKVVKSRLQSYFKEKISTPSRF